MYPSSLMLLLARYLLIAMRKATKIVKKAPTKFLFINKTLIYHYNHIHKRSLIIGPLDFLMNFYFNSSYYTYQSMIG